MALGVPTNFQAVSNVLANYDFVDIASGTGYINFYAGNTVDLKLLSNNTFYSDVVATTASSVCGAYTKILDVDFDVVLNRPLDIKGIGIIQIPVSLNIDAAIAHSPSTYIDVSFQKWDGSTETNIITNTSRVFSGSVGNSPAIYSLLAVDLNIPQNHFKIGETIRIRLEMYGIVDGGHQLTCGIGNDPKNRTAGWDTTGAVPSQLIFQCPVRLNL